MFRNAAWMLAAGSGLMLAGGAQAASFLDLVQFGENNVSDDAAQYLLRDGNGNGLLDEGDVIRGYVNFHALNSTGANLGGLTGNNEFTGIFQLKVTGKSDNGDGSFTFTFGPDENFSFADNILGTSNNSNNAMVLLFDDPAADADFHTSRAVAHSTSTNGTSRLVFAIGFNDPDAASRIENGSVVSDNGEGWVARGGEQFKLLQGVDPGSIFGESNFAANLVSEIGDGASLPLISRMLGGSAGLFGADPDALVQFIGNSTVSGADGRLANAGFDAGGQTEFTFALVPTPAALGPGLGLLAMMFARRRRQA